MRIGKLLLVGMIMVGAAHAEITEAQKRKTVTSQHYVETELGTKQPKIPAAGTNSANAGTSVVMYTSTGNGTIGERALFTGATTYNAGNDSNKLVTAAALDGAVNNLPTITTSKLTCANQNDGCTLWTIGDQNVYGEENSGTGGD